MLDVANAEQLDADYGISLRSKVKSGPESADAQQGKGVVFSEVNLYSMARTERYKVTIDSLTRQPLEMYDLEDDPNELRNLVDHPRLSGLRNRFLTDYFSHLLANLNEPQLKVYQDGGIPTKLHQEYPEY